MLDAGEGERRKREAIERVAASNQEWLFNAWPYLKQICRERAKFSTDEVWELLVKNGLGYVRERRAMGALMVMGAKAGLYESASELSKSSMPLCHRRPKLNWVSLIY